MQNAVCAHFLRCRRGPKATRPGWGRAPATRPKPGAPRRGLPARLPVPSGPLGQKYGRALARAKAAALCPRSLDERRPGGPGEGARARQAAQAAGPRRALGRARPARTRAAPRSPHGRQPREENGTPRRPRPRLPGRFRPGAPRGLRGRAPGRGRSPCLWEVARGRGEGGGGRGEKKKEKEKFLSGEAEK